MVKGLERFIERIAKSRTRLPVWKRRPAFFVNPQERGEIGKDEDRREGEEPKESER